MLLGAAVAVVAAASAVAAFLPPIPEIGGSTADCVATPQICDSRLGLRLSIVAGGLMVAAAIAAFAFWDPDRRPRR